MAKIYHECLVHGRNDDNRWADCDLIYEYKYKGELRYRAYALSLVINYEFGSTPLKEYYMNDVSENEKGMMRWIINGAERKPQQATF